MLLLTFSGAAITPTLTALALANALTNSSGFTVTVTVTAASALTVSLRRRAFLRSIDGTHRCGIMRIEIMYLKFFGLRVSMR